MSNQDKKARVSDPDAGRDMDPKADDAEETNVVDTDRPIGLTRRVSSPVPKEP